MHWQILDPSRQAVLPILALSLSACGDTWGQRAATGGAIGAGTGLAVGALAGWPLVGPALVGGVIGALLATLRWFLG